MWVTTYSTAETRRLLWLNANGWINAHIDIAYICVRIFAQIGCSAIPADSSMAIKPTTIGTALVMKKNMTVTAPMTLEGC